MTTTFPSELLVRVVYPALGCFVASGLGAWCGQRLAMGVLRMAVVKP